MCVCSSYCLDFFRFDLQLHAATPFLSCCFTVGICLCRESDGNVGFVSFLALFFCCNCFHLKEKMKEKNSWELGIICLCGDTVQLSGVVLANFSATLEILP